MHRGDEGGDAPTTPAYAGIEADGGDDDTTAAVVRDKAGAAPAAPGTRYIRKAPLGKGGMGVVHLCHDARLRRDVALKTAPDALAADPAIRSMLLREARIQARLEHPAIVPVHDLGAADGVPFFTMRRIEGTSLHAVLNRLRAGEPEATERYGTRRLLAAFSTICVAVAFAHSRGVLHRDIKPANIVLGDYGEVYLIDFGVAKVADARDIAAGAQMVGTIGYVAPEQARGDDVDERADVYSLGAILFELLTLQRLHEGEAPAALLSTTRGADARASVRAPDRAVPPELEALCVRATALAREERFATAAELHEEVERFLDGHRDLARRRELARQHVGRAREALVRAFENGVDRPARRDEALDEANRALALDPESDDARHALAEVVVMTQPGAEVQDMQRGTLAGVRSLLVRTGIAFGSLWAAGAALVLFLGVRSWALASAAAVATILAAAFVLLRAQSDAMWVRVGAGVACHVAAVFSATVFGPFVVLPGVLACLAVAFTIATLPTADETEPPLLRPAAIALSATFLLLPVILEVTGVIAPSVLFRDGTIVILPRLVDFPPGGTLGVLVAANLCLVIVPALIAQRVRDYAFDVERRSLEAASRLRQLIPREARSVAEISSSDE
jgi:serine/threonine-protein kinase